MGGHAKVGTGKQHGNGVDGWERGCWGGTGQLGGHGVAGRAWGSIHRPCEKWTGAREAQRPEKPRHSPGAFHLPGLHRAELPRSPGAARWGNGRCRCGELEAGPPWRPEALAASPRPPGPGTCSRPAARPGRAGAGRGGGGGEIGRRSGARSHGPAAAARRGRWPGGGAACRGRPGGRGGAE